MRIYMPGHNKKSLSLELWFRTRETTASANADIAADMSNHVSEGVNRGRIDVSDFEQSKSDFVDISDGRESGGKLLLETELALLEPGSNETCKPSASSLPPSSQLPLNEQTENQQAQDIEGGAKPTEESPKDSDAGAKSTSEAVPHSFAVYERPSLTVEGGATNAAGAPGGEGGAPDPVDYNRLRPLHPIENARQKWELTGGLEEADIEIEQERANQVAIAPMRLSMTNESEIEIHSLDVDPITGNHDEKMGLVSARSPRVDVEASKSMARPDDVDVKDSEVVKLFPAEATTPQPYLNSQMSGLTGEEVEISHMSAEEPHQDVMSPSGERSVRSDETDTDDLYPRTEEFDKSEAEDDNDKSALGRSQQENLDASGVAGEQSGLTPEVSMKSADISGLPSMSRQDGDRSGLRSALSAPEVDRDAAKSDDTDAYQSGMPHAASHEGGMLERSADGTDSDLRKVRERAENDKSAQVPSSSADKYKLTATDVTVGGLQSGLSTSETGLDKSGAGGMSESDVADRSAQKTFNVDDGASVDTNDSGARPEYTWNIEDSRPPWVLEAHTHLGSSKNNQTPRVVKSYDEEVMVGEGAPPADEPKLSPFPEEKDRGSGIGSQSGILTPSAGEDLTTDETSRSREVPSEEIMNTEVKLFQRHLQEMSEVMQSEDYSKSAGPSAPETFDAQTFEEKEEIQAEDSNIRDMTPMPSSEAPEERTKVRRSFSSLGAQKYLSRNHS